MDEQFVTETKFSLSLANLLSELRVEPGDWFNNLKMDEAAYLKHV
jgi:hypothetical protein